MKKKWIALCLCLLLVAVNVVPAYASEDDTPTPYTYMDGNGYTVRSIIVNGKSYDVRLTLSFSATDGARSSVSCAAPIDILIGNVSVTYDTKNYGYVTNSGGGKLVSLPYDSNYYAYSGYVVCSVGMSQVINYTTMSGSATFYGFGTNATNATVSTTMTPPSN